MTNTIQTKLIQDTLAECGWRDARLLEQQDTSEAFAFITETLDLPLLALQADLFHPGKPDTDDHKVVYERLLNVPVPPASEGKELQLEDCLEEYFNTKVDVLRDSHDDKKSIDRSVLPPRSTIRLVTEEEGPQVNGEIQLSPVPMTPTTHIERRWTASAGPRPNESTTISEESSGSIPRPSQRHRSTSVFQRIVIDEQGHPETLPQSASLLQQVTRRGSTIVKAITIPAWQFFRLIRRFISGASPYKT
jgi:hypothetical protein